MQSAPKIDYWNFSPAEDIQVNTEYDLGQPFSIPMLIIVYNIIIQVL